MKPAGKKNPAGAAPPAAPWLADVEAESLAREFGTPLYVYSAEVLRARCRQLFAAFPGVGVRYAMKANACPAVLDLIRREGAGVDAVSAWEVKLARELGFEKRAIVYSGSNPSDEELAAVARAGVAVNLDALSSLERYGKVNPGAKVSLRLNLEIGGGHHPHVVTAGPDSKFGLAREDLRRARSICARHGLRVAGLHQHIGSGLFDPKLYERALDPLFDLALEFPALEFVDVGGGFGVPYAPGEKPLDLTRWGRSVLARRDALVEKLGRGVRVLIEPGRFVVAEAGALLTRVTTVKRTRDRVFVGVDSGMHHLVRPAMYGSYHPLRAVPARRGSAERCFVVGPICESGDVLAENRTMPVPREGDLLLVGVAGAYGYAMASTYNLRPRPAEVMLEGGRARVVRERERYRDVLGRWGL